MSLKLVAMAGATLALCASIDPLPAAAQAVTCADMYGRVMALYQAAPLSPAYNQMAAAYTASCLAGRPAAQVYMPNGFVADPVGLIVAGGIRPAPPSFPGLLDLVGLGLGAGAIVVDRVLTGGPSQY